MSRPIFLLGVLFATSASAHQIEPLSTSEKWMQVMNPQHFHHHYGSIMDERPVEQSDLEKLAKFRLLYEAPQNGDDPSFENSDCKDDMDKVFEAAESKTPWAMQFTDSWGQRPSGLMKVNLKWYGEFDQCIAIKPLPDAPFGSKYCLVQVGLMGVSPVTMGVCVSDRCTTNEEIHAAISSHIPIPFQLSPNGTRCVDNNPPLEKNAYISIGIFSAIGFFLLLGLLADIYLRVRRFFEAKKAVEAIPMQVIKKPDAESPPTDQPPLPVQSATAKKPAASPKTFSEYLLATILAFSPLSNFEKIFKMPGKTPPGFDFSATNGIRALSLFHVMLAHQFMFLGPATDNPAILLTLQGRWTAHFISAGIFAVDTFFFLSGFFAYFSMSKVYKKGVSVAGFLRSLPKVYLLRYLRLTPPYAAIILISVGLWQYLANGPFYRKTTDPICVENWWKHLLYINNFFTAQCVGWSWYMPVDFQMYLVSPFAIYAFVRWPIVGWVFAASALIANIVYNAVVTVKYDLFWTLMQPVHISLNDLLPYPKTTTPENVVGVAPGGGGGVDFGSLLGMAPQNGTTGNFFDDYYDKPYARMGPFIIGIVFCHILIQHEKLLRRTIFRYKQTQLIGWVVCLGIFGSLIYGSVGQFQKEGYYTNPQWANALYNAVARTAWGIAIGWIIIASALKHGGIIGDFLAWPFWSIPAKISYCSYLINPMVIDFFTQTLRRPYHYTDITMIFIFVATAINTLLCAVLLSLGFESPTVGLLSLFLK